MAKKANILDSFISISESIRQAKKNEAKKNAAKKLAGQPRAQAADNRAFAARIRSAKKTKVAAAKKAGAEGPKRRTPVRDSKSKYATKETVMGKYPDGRAKPYKAMTLTRDGVNTNRPNARAVAAASRGNAAASKTPTQKRAAATKSALAKSNVVKRAAAKKSGAEGPKGRTPVKKK